MQASLRVASSMWSQQCNAVQPIDWDNTGLGTNTRYPGYRPIHFMVDIRNFFTATPGFLRKVTFVK